jgi:tetratricopeptide (TPR) repeat protein
LTPARALILPLAFTLPLVGVSFLPVALHSLALRWTLWGSGAALVVWAGALLATARGRRLTLEIVIRKQHYLQACAQATVFLYWGWYWREAYGAAPLIAAQLAFAYAFDMLLTWSRRDSYVFGFGPFPIIFSMNLFLWFKPDWFYFQFVMVAIGFTVKEFVRWQKNGRRTHIFNPSSFPLGLVSLVLILTGTTHLTWGREIATTQLYAPHIYLVIFLVGLPGQFLFGVVSMTLAAVATTLAFGVVYFAATGTYFFLDSYVPIAVFLGMHLLFTDPSTSPGTELGRILFGVAYALSVITLFSFLGRAGVPTFYDKLLAVPILNLMIQSIDAIAGSALLKRFDPAKLGRRLTARQRNVAYMTVWAVVFGLMQLQTGTQVALARGNAFLDQGNIEEAIGRYRAVTESKPQAPLGHRKLGDALLVAGRAREALRPLQRAVELAPDIAEAHNNLGLALIQSGGNQRDAVASLQRAVDLRPDYREAHYNLAHALSMDQPQAAVREFREALTLRADWPEALRDLALLLATHPEADVRDPKEALRLASRAADLSRGADPFVLYVLSASYAANGRFEEAIATGEQAEALATGGPPELRTVINARLNLYRTGRSFDVP